MLTPIASMFERRQSAGPSRRMPTARAVGSFVVPKIVMLPAKIGRDPRPFTYRPHAPTP